MRGRGTTAKKHWCPESRLLCRSMKNTKPRKIRTFFPNRNFVYWWLSYGRVSPTTYVREQRCPAEQAAHHAAAAAAAAAVRMTHCFDWQPDREKTVVLWRQVNFRAVLAYSRRTLNSYYLPCRTDDPAFPKAGAAVAAAAASAAAVATAVPPPFPPPRMSPLSPFLVGASSNPSW